MSYLLTTYHWPLLSRPQVAGFKCPVTDVVLCHKESVEGVLFTASKEHMMLLDEKEGEKAGVYKRLSVKVKLDDGKEVEATTYQVCSPKPFQAPHRDYLRIIIEGARAHGLSERWIRKLEEIPTRD